MSADGRGRDAEKMSERGGREREEDKAARGFRAGKERK
jgi:hypothetical protein